MVEIYILEINMDLNSNDFNKLLSFTSQKKKEQILRFRRFEDKQRSLLGEVLARYAICKSAGCENKDLVISTNEYGKPVIIENPGVHFNISHSGKWVVCAVDSNPVGIDVEEIAPIDIRLAERFFSKNEYISILNQCEEMKQKYFYMIWTLKESFVKAEGKGLSIPLNSFEIVINNSDISIFQGSNSTIYSGHQFFLSNAVCSICFFKGTSFHVKEFSLKNFLEDFIPLW